MFNRREYGLVPVVRNPLATINRDIYVLGGTAIRAGNAGHAITPLATSSSITISMLTQYQPCPKSSAIPPLVK